MQKTTPFRLITNDAKYARAAAHPEAQHRLDRRSVQVDSGCIEWVGARSTGGYGVLTVDKQSVYAHRLAYVVAFGPIASGMVIDHGCHNRACVNPRHLAVVTVEANSARTPMAAQTHCKNGHEFTDENTRVHYDNRHRPHRHCRDCSAERSRVWREARAA